MHETGNMDETTAHPPTYPSVSLPLPSPPFPSAPWPLQANFGGEGMVTSRCNMNLAQNTGSDNEDHALYTAPTRHGTSKQAATLEPSTPPLPAPTNRSSESLTGPKTS